VGTFDEKPVDNDLMLEFFHPLFSATVAKKCRGYSEW
jgi:hypothetical protein